MIHQLVCPMLVQAPYSLLLYRRLVVIQYVSACTGLVCHLTPMTGHCKTWTSEDHRQTALTISISGGDLHER